MVRLFRVRHPYQP